MQNDMQLLVVATIIISFLHTVTGPDHYLPFIALSKTRKWPVRKTITWTLLCGLGHILSSLVLVSVAVLAGWSVSSLSVFDGIRGSIAGWSLLIFGLLYSIWGWIKIKRNSRHRHFDIYDDGSVYVYEHRHGETVMPQEKHAVTPWVLFIIFILGPCEPIIPLLYLPAVNSSWLNMVIIIAIYTFFTLITMLLIVLLGYYGLGFLKWQKIEKYTPLLAGFTLLLCGAGMVFLEW